MSHVNDIEHCFHIKHVIFIQSGARNVIHFNIRVRFQEIVRQNKVIYGILFINNNFLGFCDAIYHDSYQFCE